ncbi:MAG TPA: helix-turn-helix domain-containing protein [Terriglobales bacterium]|nr:helix-turn-helix domain-containing protein [Terriglobales bacterium]
MAPSLPADIHAPKQARSLESMRRLIDAARQILNEDGLEAATIPRIAERAGLSVGSVYRRFPDKDALLREICLQHFLDKQEFLSKLAQEIPPEATLSEIIPSMAQGMMHSFTENAGLMRASIYYFHEQAAPKVRQKIDRAIRRMGEITSGILLSRRRQINHPDPELAAPLAITMMSSTIREIALYPNQRMTSAEYNQVASELAQAACRYLGVSK